MKNIETKNIRKLILFELDREPAMKQNFHYTFCLTLW